MHLRTDMALVKAQHVAFSIVIARLFRWPISSARPSFLRWSLFLKIPLIRKTMIIAVEIKDIFSQRQGVLSQWTAHRLSKCRVNLEMVYVHPTIVQILTLKPKEVTHIPQSTQ